jgi:hypothetical protein
VYNDQETCDINLKGRYQKVIPPFSCPYRFTGMKKLHARFQSKKATKEVDDIKYLADAG